jgi:hypothetical protein
MRPPSGRSSFNPTQDPNRRGLQAAIGSRLAAGILILVALAIAWRVATTGVAAFLAAEDPELALRFDPGQPEALLRQARLDVLEADAAGAETAARRALEARPLNAPAFRSLAYAASERGDRASADAMMARTAALTRRDASASSWMFNKAVAARDYRQAFRHADALLRRSPAYEDSLFPQMITAADQPAAADALVRRLALGPLWRPPFLAMLAGQAPEETIRGVLRRVQASPRPLNDVEMAWVLRRYLDRHDRREVRALWTELLSPRDRTRLAAIFDGGFETQTGRQPFGWQATGERSVSAQFAEVGGATGKALHAEHFGSGSERIISQMIALDPGDYRLSGRAMAEGGGEPDALVWRVACEGGRNELVGVRPAEAGAWKSFAVAFSVPDGCDIQTLSLESRPSGGGGASAWFDDLRIEPVEGMAL